MIIKNKPKFDKEKYKIFLIRKGDELAMKLRKSATPWEKALYKILKDLHYKFEFQKPVIVPVSRSYKLYILDFCLKDFPIFLEVDSKQFHTTKEQRKKDSLRSRHLKKIGLYPVRLFNNQIATLNKDVISDLIKNQINMLTTVKKINIKD